MKLNVPPLNQRPLIWVTILFLVILIIKTGISLFFLSPQSFADELVYDQVARLILSGQVFGGVYPTEYPPLYPAILSLAYLLPFDKIGIYHTEMILNCILSTLLMFPSFLILRRYCPVNISLPGSVLVTLLPMVTGHSFLLVSENLFILLFVISAWLSLCTFSRPEPGLSDLLLGTTVLFLILTRQTGLAMVISIFVASALYAFLLRNKVSLPVLVKKEGCILSPVLLVGIIWALDKVFQINRLPRVPSALFGGSQIIQAVQNNAGVLMRTTVMEYEYIVLSGFLVLFFFSLYALYRMCYPAREVDMDTKYGDIVSAVYLFLSSILLFIIATVFVFGILNPGTPTVYGRYIDPIIPVMALYGIIGIFSQSGNMGKERRSDLVFIVYILISAGLFGLFYLVTLPEPNNNLGILYLYRFLTELIPFTILIPVCIAGVIYVLIRKKVQIPIVLGVLIVLSLLMTIPVINYELRMSENYWQIGKFCGDLDKSFSPHERYIWDDTENNGRYDPVYYQTMKFWFTDRLNSRQVEKNIVNGTVLLSIPGIAKGEDWLISRADYPMIAKGKIEDFRIYSLKK